MGRSEWKKPLSLFYDFRVDDAVSGCSDLLYGQHVFADSGGGKSIGISVTFRGDRVACFGAEHGNDVVIALIHIGQHEIEVVGRKRIQYE